jgi:hypothetical protein
MLWLCLTFHLAAAVLIYPEFVTADVTASGSDPTFAGFSVASEISVAVWVKPFSELSGESVIWEAKKSAADGAPSLTLSQTSATLFRGCYNGTCKEISVQEGLFIWSYLAVSVKGTSLRVCQADWSSRSTTCEVAEVSAEAPLLGSDFEVKVYAQRVRSKQVELHSFELLNAFLSTQDLQAKATAFSCHSICPTCFGPAPNACNEFTALIGLDELTIDSSDTLVIPATDVKFQGRSYFNIENFSVTFWFYVNPNDNYRGSLISFNYPSKGCDDYQNGYSFPNVVCTRCSYDYHDLKNHIYSETCQENYIDNIDSYNGYVFPVRSIQGLTNGWLYSGTFYDYANMLTKTILSKFGAENQGEVTLMISRHMTWDSSAGNHITIKDPFECAVRFMDVRVYFNPPVDFSLEQIWTQGNALSNPKCWACVEGELKYIHNGIFCVDVCPERTFQVDTTCLDCNAGCESCASNAECLTCIAGMKKYMSNGLQCIVDCPDGMYLENEYCLDCDAGIGCSTCSSSTQCMTCLSTKLQYQSPNLQCLDACPSGTYLEGSSCLSCDAEIGCATCSSLTQCLTCLPTKLQYQSSSLQCLGSCPFGTYKSGSSCLDCDAGIGCTTCSSSTQCLTCLASKFQYQSPSLQCLDVCPSGTYTEASSCLSCDAASGCETCSSATQCLTCLAAKLQYQTTSLQCLDACPNGTYISNSSCLDCGADNGCATCSSLTQCLTCLPAKLQYQSPNLQCLDTCPSGTYLEASSCLSCDAAIGCATCSSMTQCLTCLPTKLKYQSSSLQCLGSCPFGTYRSGSSCLDCDTRIGCATCSSSTQCLTCLSSKFQYRSDRLQCLDKCPSGTYQNLNDRLCFDCDMVIGCLTCSSYDQCLTCLPSRIEYTSTTLQCVSSCPEGTYLSFKSCLPCDQTIGCKSCSTTTQCLSCAQDKLQYQLNGLLQCVNACPSSTYIEGDACVKCDVSCSSCSGPTSKDCSNCAQDFVKYGDQCINCVAGQGFTLVEGKGCVSCHENCGTCTGTSFAECSVCAEGNYIQPYSETICLPSCPFGSSLESGQCSEMKSLWLASPSTPSRLSSTRYRHHKTVSCRLKRRLR